MDVSARSKSDNLAEAVAPALPETNRLLASISARAYARIESELEVVHFKHGDPVYRRGGSISHLYFPTTAIISLFNDTPTGASAEVSLIGNDGALGIWSIVCGVRPPFRAAVDHEGHGYRMSHMATQEEFKRGGSFQRAMLQHLTVRMMMAAANVVCNGQHSVKQRFCRALLMRLERTGSTRVGMTHETMAQVLGVRRVGVTRAAAQLKRAGALAYTRGQIVVTDQELLLKCACECYALIKKQIEQLRTR